jgi:uncharacterized protein
MIKMFQKRKTSTFQERVTTIQNSSLNDSKQKTLTMSFFYMALGLVISGIAAVLFASEPQLNALIFNKTFEGVSLTILGWIVLIAPIGLVFALSWLRDSISETAYTGLYLGYTFINGITLSVIFMAYTLPSVISTFFITAGMFVALALFGMLTKRDLSAMGTFLLAAVFGLIIAMFANMFLRSAMMDYIISFVGVVVFSCLIAYDTQRIKKSGALGFTTKLAVDGALHLYLNFINLFLFLLRLFGSKK